MPFLLNEDWALWHKLGGLTVTDPNSGPTGRKVPVNFWLPENEISDMSYPSIIIEPKAWSYAPERQHDGIIQLPYAPENFPQWWNDTGPDTSSFKPGDSPYTYWFPTAINIDYQITVFSRNMPMHTIPIESQLAAYDKLHPRFPFLDIPQDGTVRTCILEAGPERSYSIQDIDGHVKRTFHSVYMLRVFSELLAPFSMAEIYGNTPVNLINFKLGVDLSIYQNISDTTPAEELFGIIATSGTMNWNTSSTN